MMTQGVRTFLSLARSSHLKNKQSMNYHTDSACSSRHWSITDNLNVSHYLAAAEALIEPRHQPQSILIFVR